MTETQNHWTVQKYCYLHLDLNKGKPSCKTIIYGSTCHLSISVLGGVQSVVAEPVECEPRLQEIRSLIPGHVKPMTRPGTENVYLSLPILVLSINTIRQRLVSSVSG